MSTNPQQDEFQNLRRLLALKRHEQPPPRYFHEFSSEVIIRIRAGEHIEQFSIWEAFSWEAPWVQKLWHAVETRPVLAGSFGIAICGFLMAGMLYSDSKPSPVIDTFAVGASPAVHMDLQAPAAPIVLPVVRPVQAGFPAVGLSPGSDNDSLFQQLRNAQGAPRVDLISTSPAH
jgi:hypothetical protein